MFAGILIGAILVCCALCMVINQIIRTRSANTYHFEQWLHARRMFKYGPKERR